MSAARIALDDLLTYCEEKTRGRYEDLGHGEVWMDWDDSQVWKLYHFLLEKAKTYKQDWSGYNSPEYQDDRERARQENSAVSQTA